MICVEQTVTEKGKGNCFAACIASILEIGIDTIPQPDFNVSTWTQYMQSIQEFLHGFGLTLIHVERTRWTTECEFAFKGPAILSVISPRGGLHAVVWQNGEVVWDPHPQRDMGIGDKLSFHFFVSVSPERNNEMVLSGITSAINLADAKMTPLLDCDNDDIQAYVIGKGAWHRVLGVSRGRRFSWEEISELNEETISENSNRWSDGDGKGSGEQ